MSVSNIYFLCAFKSQIFSVWARLGSSHLSNISCYLLCALICSSACTIATLVTSFRCYFLCAWIWSSSWAIVTCAMATLVTILLNSKKLLVWLRLGSPLLSNILSCYLGNWCPEKWNWKSKRKKGLCLLRIPKILTKLAAILRHLWF